MSCNISANRASAAVSDGAQTGAFSARQRAAAMALILGILVVFTSGFAYPEILHNAAHDARHASGFPCH